MFIENLKLALLINKFNVNGIIKNIVDKSFQYK